MPRDIKDDSLREFIAHEEMTTSEQNTVSNRKTAIRVFDEWLEEMGKTAENAGPLSIETYAGWLTPNQSSEAGKELAESTASRYLYHVQAYFEWREKKRKEEGDDGEEIENPFDDADISMNGDETQMSKELHDDKGYVAMSPEQYEKLMDQLPSPKARNQLMFQVMWDCGLRPEEVCSIRISDIDRDTREISIRSEKTYLNRTVFYGETVSQMLRIWLDMGERDRYNPAERSEHLLISQQSEQISTRTIQRTFAETREAAGIAPKSEYTDAQGREQYKLRPYSLRHGFAERMVDRGVDLETLRKVMGHKKIETTKKYVNPGKKKRRNRIQSALDD